MLLNRIILILFHLLFLVTPLIMAPFTSELFEFNKMMFIYLVTLGVGLIWLLKMLVSRKIIIKKTIFDIPLLLFFLSQVLSTIFSIDSHTSFFGYYGRFNGGLLSLIAYLILYYAFISNVSENIQQKIEGLFKTSLLASLMVIVWGISGKLGIDFSCLLFTGQIGNSCWTDQFRPAERMFSTLGQPNWLGAYLVVNFFIGSYFFLKQIKEKNGINFKYILFLIYLALNFSAVLFTRSRSSLFAIFVGFLILVLYLFKKLKIDFLKNKSRQLIGLVVALIIIVVGFKTGIEQIDKFISLPSIGSKSQSISVKQSVQPLNGVTASADIRKIVWKGAVNLGLKYPVLGTGVETFAYSYYFTRPQEHNLTSEWDFLYNKAHNEYLNYFATTGFFGLLSYIVLILFVLIMVVKFINKEKSSTFLYISLLVAWFSILVTNFFGFSTTTVNLFFYLIPAFIAALNSNNVYLRLPFLEKKIRLIRLILMILIILTSYLFVGLTRYYLADLKYAEGDSLSKLGEYQKAAELLQQADNLKHEHVYIDKLSNILANIAFTAAYQKEGSVAAKLIQESDNLNKKSIKESQSNVLYWKTRAKNYYLYYQINPDPKYTQEAITALTKAQELAPTDPKIAYSLAIFYSLLSDDAPKAKNNSEMDFALAEINKSILMKPDYRDAYFLKGQLLKKEGKTDEARKVFLHILERLNPNDEEVKKELL